jgi:hypothetical protein
MFSVSNLIEFRHFIVETGIEYNWIISMRRIVLVPNEEKKKKGREKHFKCDHTLKQKKQCIWN